MLQLCTTSGQNDRNDTRGNRAEVLDPICWSERYATLGDIVWRRAVLAVASTIICGLWLPIARTAAQSIDPAPLPNDVPIFYRFYAGGALNWVHHSGYAPNSLTQADTQQYALGGKAFGGVRINPSWQFEVSYYYLGKAEVAGLPLTTDEHSYAVSGSVLYLSPPLQEFVAGIASWHLLVRLGMAHKWIVQTSDAGTLKEGTLAAVLGLGVEFRITPQVFARVEYEYLSTAIGGPRQSVPGFKGLLHVDLGGTERVVNVMHTPLAFTLGVNF